MAKLVSATYGDALFELAVQESKVDSLYAEATDCLKVFEENSELGRLLNHPKIDKSEKEKVIEKCFWTVCFKGYNRSACADGFKRQAETNYGNTPVFYRQNQRI